jgi:hypothetical protein
MRKLIARKDTCLKAIETIKRNIRNGPVDSLWRSEMNKHALMILDIISKDFCGKEKIFRNPEKL